MAAETDDAPPRNSVLGPFLDFLKEYKTLLAAMIGIGTTAAVASAVTTLGPPWPGRLAVASLTGVSSMLLLAWTFVSMRRQPDANYVRRMGLAIGVVGFFALVYFTLWATLIHESVAGNVVGLRSIRPEVLQVMEHDGMTIEQAIQAANEDPGRVYLYSWGDAARVALLATWVGFLCGVSAVLTTLLLALEAQKASGAAVAWGEGPAR